MREQCPLGATTWGHRRAFEASAPRLRFRIEHEHISTGYLHVFRARAVPEL